MSERGGEAAKKNIYSTDACLVIQVVSEVILIEQCSNSPLLHKRLKNEFKNIFHFSHPMADARITLECSELARGRLVKFRSRVILVFLSFFFFSFCSYIKLTYQHRQAE